MFANVILLYFFSFRPETSRQPGIQFATPLVVKNYRYLNSVTGCMTFRKSTQLPFSGMKALVSI